MQALNDLRFSPEEERFAPHRFDLAQPVRSMASRRARQQGGAEQRFDDVREYHRGADDRVSTVCWVPGTPGHSWQATAAGGTTIGRKGMLLAAKVLAATAYDLATNAEAIAAAKDELTRRVGKEGYRSLLAPGKSHPWIIARRRWRPQSRNKRSTRSNEGAEFSMVRDRALAFDGRGLS